MFGKLLMTFMVCGVAAAQQPPGDMPLLEQCAADAPLTRIRNVPASQRSLLWRDTRIVGDGYFETTVDPGYLRLVEQMLALPATKARKPVASAVERADSTLNNIATLHESPFRTTEFYADGISKVMFTRWAFAAAGAKLCLFDEFMNAQVRNAAATLSLTKSSATDDRRALWKLTWITADTVQYELYVEDRLTLEGSPARSAPDVLELAVRLSAKRE